MQEPDKGAVPQPLPMTEDEKKEAFRNHIIGMVNSMNRSQRRAFLVVAQKSQSLEKATEAAIKRGWVPGQKK